ncbi:50S ribosomal protein L10e [candidate division MSBL1 archaeon SCGC-AAA259A05]|uniref:Large ribosomal subunit protein uL16 n=1 Tax=candidate division MSBL1 archaeon SCGC-AAA259A05 TaxID=1698259 RepID=A0A133U9L2_9EURY|nr:50S ribosomal protein L10e [candidate division MSBL1 archaeon SCGC-AAA259A05]
MTEKPASSYREQSNVPYTKKEYITGKPASRIGFFEMGDPEGDFAVRLSLKSEEKGQIRDNALDAARVSANSFLQEEIGRENYFLKLRVHPHHILRENPMAIGAGADRISDGMRKSFGRPTGLAARVSAGQKIFVLDVVREAYETGREALRRVRMKLPLPASPFVEEGGELLSR